PVRPPVVLLEDPRAVGLGELVILVGEERERQAELLAEGALALGSLRAHAPHVRAAFVDGLVGVTELARLDGAAGRVVLGIEVEDRPLAALIRQAVDRARLVGEGDFRRYVARFRDAHSTRVAGVSMTRSRPLRTVTAALLEVRTLESPRAGPGGSGSSSSG